MANLFDYLKWRGDISFEQVPLNTIDALMLSHLSYSIFDGLLTDSFTDQKTLFQLAQDFKNSPDYKERINIGFLINKHTAELMFECAVSERFKNVKICGYKTIYDEERTEQFAAMTYLVGDTKIISYRGTDDTLIGWREDFNIAWQNPIPAQIDAMEYLKKAAESFSGNIIIIGHSKGGNLVINSAVKADRKIKDRITKLYNFDGPGFSKAFFESDEYKEIEPKLISVYPEFSIVGMIFDHPCNYIITKSSGFAVMQHDALTWQICGSDFDRAEDFNDESKFFHEAFNDWVKGLSSDQIEKFVNALWEVIDASGAKTNTEFQDNALTGTAKMLVKLSSLEKETKKEVHQILGMLRDAVRKDSPFAKLFNFQK